MANSLWRTFQSFFSSMTSSDSALPAYDPTKSCWLLSLPPEILQSVTDHLNVPDLLSLSRTCQTLHALINDDRFWSHRIHRQFPPSVAQLYTHDVFQPPELVDTTNEVQRSGFQNVRADGELDLLAITSATHYNDEAVERRRVKMYVSKEAFLEQLQYFQFTRPSHRHRLPFMKLIYFYLIDRKRCAAEHMSVIHLNGNYLSNQPDANSLTGRVICLRSVCWLEITGRFEQLIMPGNYEVTWRMKSNGGRISLHGETEFIVVPSHGRLLVARLVEADLQNYALEHGTQWFTAKLGQIRIYEPSRVLVAIRNWINGYWKSGISWDCIELKMIP